MFRYTKQVNDYSALAVTKLDILDKLDEILIGVEYVKDGKKLDYYPSSEFQFEGVEVSTVIIYPSFGIYRLFVSLSSYKKSTLKFGRFKSGCPVRKICYYLGLESYTLPVIGI
jgi:Adenylosuccinate synthetase